MESPSQSSTGYGGVAARALDGNTSGVWRQRSVTHTANENEAWWTANLEEAATISEIEIWNRTNCCTARLSDFYVLVSDSPFESTDLTTTLNDENVWSAFHSGAVEVNVSIPVDSIGRYIRIQLEGKNPLSLAEVVVHGTVIESGFSALPMESASQSSTSYGGVAARALDGNTSGVWNQRSVTHTANENEAWWTANLEEAATISEIEIWNRTNCCTARLSDFYVLISDSPFESTDLTTTLNDENVWSAFHSGAVDVNVSIPVASAGQYVRIQLQGKNPLSLAEVVVIGEPILNQAPIVVNDIALVVADAAVLIDVLDNDSDDSPLTESVIAVKDSPTHGTAEVIDGIIGYSHSGSDAVEFPTDTFTYAITDGGGLESNVATVTVTIEAAPVVFMANADTASVDENGSVAIDVLANDTGDLDASTVRTNVTPSPSKGYLRIDAETGVITYTPYTGNPGFVDTFGYQVKNAAGVLSEVALVTVTIEAEAIILMANADAADVGDGASVAIDVLANDTGDIDPTTVRTNVSPSPAKGYLRTDADTGVITYTSYVGNVGYTDTFGYQVKDDAGVLSNVALVSVTIVGDVVEPQTVLAVNDSATLVAQTGLLIDVLANDVGATSESVIDSLQITVEPSQGTAEIQQGQVLYTHGGTDALADTFTYAITDDDGVISSASVAITIEPQANEAPIAVDDEQILTAYDEVQIAVLANDYDNDIADLLDVASVIIVQQPTSGIVSVEEGVVTYTHDGSLSESDYFSYTVADSQGAESNIAIVDLTIEPYPDTAPVVGDDSFSLVAYNAGTIDVLANDTDKNHNIDSGSLVIVQAPSAGTVQIVDGVVVYDHDGGASETDSFTYMVSDLTELESEAATVSITVEPVLPPVVSDESLTLEQGDSVLIDVLANDTANTAINPASIFITLDPEHAAEFDVQEDGFILYTHQGDGSLTDTINYKIRNEQGMESLESGVVNIKIIAPLVTINELSYEGAFKFPGSTYGDSTASYAQGVIEVNGGSIFIAGHSQHDAIAEYLVPTLVKDSFEVSSLNAAANPVQDFSAVIERAATGNPESLDQITGLELVDGQLFINLVEYYDAPADNTLTTMVISDADNLATSQVSALHSMDGAARAAGWLSPVPDNWKAELGTDFISGHSSGDPIISRLSVGPSAFAIDLPASLEGTESATISTTELQGFSLSNPLHTDLYNTTRSNAVWTHLSRARYGFIVPGTGTYMTLGWSGGHQSGVGYKLTREDGSECPGFCAEDETDMHNYFWLWKVEDWLRVKSGEIQPHEIAPYESGELDLPFQTTGELNEIGGASYDPLTGLLYISILRANESGYDLTPVVVAYEVTTPTFIE